MRLAYIFIVASLVFSGCAGSLKAPTPVAQTVEAKNQQYVIIPGKGLSELMLGSNESNFTQLFGGNRQGSYLVAESNGVDARVTDGKISVLFFYFFSNSHNSFNGKTREGVGKDSTIDDVIVAYGKPDRIGESIISQFGAMPGAHEKSIDYHSIGIWFTFWDGYLADVRVLQAKQ
jgi:hypothetical protein